MVAFLIVSCLAFRASPWPVRSALTQRSPLTMQAAERSSHWHPLYDGRSWPALDDGRSLEDIQKMADAVL
eukprot:1537670-Prymnesium_polylepis.1